MAQAIILRPREQAPQQEELTDPAALSIDADPRQWVLDGRRFDAVVTDRVTGGGAKSTIEAASTLTLTVRDSDRKLLRSGIFSRAVELDAVGLEWSLTAVAKTGDELELVFEDREVAEQRRHNRPRKVARDRKTRAEFVKMLVEEGDTEVVFVCPELRVRQPVGTKKERRERLANRDRGIADDAELQGKEGRLSKAELRNAERALDVADALDSPERATLALIEACLVEGPDFQNPVGGEGSSSGMLQLTAGHLGGSTSTSGGRRDIELICRLFLTQGFAGRGGAIALARENPDWNPGRIAQAVQGSAFPSRYAEVGEQAREIYDAYGGTSGTRERTITETKRYEFSRGRPGGPKGENTWECALRLAEEVGWRRFIVRKRFYFISEEDLIRSKPRARIREHRGGVDDIDFEIDGRQKVDEATVTCRAKYWRVPPGAVVIVEEQGLADGRWLVSEIDRPDLWADALTVSLRRGAALLKEKPEPSPETVTRTLRAGRRFTVEGGGRQARARAIYEAASFITDQRRPYVYGGGHGPPLKSLVGGKAGLDCSSSTALALWMAGQMEGDVAQVSGWFASSYGAPGPGEFVTVWANGGHVWIEFNLPGLPGRRFDTSPHGSGGSGPRMRYTDRSTAGFTARHPA
jgi:hypothetical protein